MGFALILLVGVQPLFAEEPKKGPQEVWEVAHVGKARIGFFHTTSEAITRNDAKLVKTTQELNLTIKRDKATAQLRMISGTEEDADGKVQAVFMKQFLDQGKQVTLRGEVEEKSLNVSINEGQFKRKIPWDAGVIGLRAQEDIFKQKKVKSGDTLTWLSYEPTINAVITVRAKVTDEEEVELLGKKAKLLRAEMTSDKIKVEGVGEIQLPKMVLWLDKEFIAVRRQVEIPGLGDVVFSRTTKALAMNGSNDTVELPDILRNTLIPLNKKLDKPHKLSEIVYRVTIKDDDNPSTALAQDERQKIRNPKGNTFELVVKAVRTPPEEETKDKPKPEFLASNYFLTSDDVKVKALAKKAVGSELDPWHKAKMIERWVSDNMKNDNSVPFATAAQIAQNLKGDCRQHAMLTAAMCRAEKIPSKTAVGLVYVLNRQGEPVFGFHMWTEVWVRGKWVAVDATLGEGSIGPAHIKIADHSWHEIQSMTPLLPVARVLGKMSIDIVEIGND